jgi:hypothetical protein
MDNDLAFREYRIPFRHIALYGIACVSLYGLVAAFGVPAAWGIAGATVGYVTACMRKK